MNQVQIKKSKKEDKNKRKIIAVIPAHNESKYIGNIVKQAKIYVDDVLVIDDASSDNTKQLAEKAGAIVLRHIVNLQKGAALKTGCEAAVNLGADIIITLDGDGQHDPNEIPKLIERLNYSDLVIGVREFNRNMPKTSRLGNIFLSKFSKFLFKSDLSDTQTGFRAFNARIYPKIAWESADYRVETEMIKNISDNRISHEEVKIKTIYNDKYKGTTPLDGIKIALNMISWRMKRKTIH